MTVCTGVITEPIRATIKFSGLTIKTPYVKAFSVDLARDRLVGTFSATVEVQAGSQFVAGSGIEIYAGIKDRERKIMTGYIRNITVNPSFDKAGYYVLSISGVDKFGDLEEGLFSRRIKSLGFASFVSITSGPQNRPSRGKSVDKRVRSGQHQFTSNTPRVDPSKSEHTELTKMPKRGSGKHGESSKTLEPGSNAAQTGASNAALVTHDHASMEKGGPAFGVFSAD